MILSNVELHKALDSGRLIIVPEPSPRTPGINVQCPYGTHSVDLLLHSEILVPTAGKFTIDLSQIGSLPEFIRKNSEKYIIN